MLTEKIEGLYISSDNEEYKAKVLSEIKGLKNISKEKDTQVPVIIKCEKQDDIFSKEDSVESSCTCDDISSKEDSVESSCT